MLEEHIVGYDSDTEGAWAISYRGTLPATEEQLDRQHITTPFVFCPICGARILPTGEGSPNG